MRKLLAVCCLALAVLPLRAQQPASETFSWDQLIVPGLLIGAGTVASFSPWYQDNVDTPLQNWALGVNGGKGLPLDNFLQFAPYLGYVAALPVDSRHNWQEKSIVIGTSFSVMMVLVYSTKYLTGVTRPNSANQRSFPSGHTALAFAGAEIVRREYGPWWGLAAYSAAVGTGFLRVYNNWHWSSDVIAGAGAGILSGMIAYWLLPLERDIFKVNNSSITASPSYIPGVNMPVVALTFKF